MKTPEFLKEDAKFKYKELTNKQYDKLVGNIEAGSKVKIYWNDENWPKNLYDKGYVFALPSHDWTIDTDLWVHIPRPENPSGKDECSAEWKHLNDLLSNDYCKKIVLECF